MLFQNDEMANEERRKNRYFIGRSVRQRRCNKRAPLRFQPFNMRWGEGWSKAISFAIFGAMIWITWTLTAPSEQPPP
jgi:hypothetical protein